MARRVASEALHDLVRVAVVDITAMTDSAVCKICKAPDCADRRVDRVAQKLVNEFISHHFDVVMHQEQKVSSCRHAAEVDEFVTPGISRSLNDTNIVVTHRSFNRGSNMIRRDGFDHDDELKRSRRVRED